MTVTIELIVRPPLVLLLMGFLLPAPTLSADDWFKQAQEAYGECRRFLDGGEYEKAEDYCEAARSSFRGHPAADRASRELVKKISRLLDDIKKRRPAPMHPVVVFPSFALAAGPGSCDVLTGCRESFPTEVQQRRFPRPGGSAALLRPGEMQLALSWQSLNGASFACYSLFQPCRFRYDRPLQLLPGGAVRSGLIKRVEVGFSWGHYLSSEGVPPSVDPTFDAKLLLWDEHGPRPKTAMMAGIGRTDPFVSVLAEHSLGKQISLRYRAGRMWNCGTLRQPAVNHFFKFGEFIFNPNKRRNFSIWNYSAAVDFPIVGAFRGVAESYGGFAPYVEATHVLNGGVMFTHRAATFQVSYAKSLSTSPFDWSLSVSFAYHLRWRPGPPPEARAPQRPTQPPAAPPEQQPAPPLPEPPTAPPERLPVPRPPERPTSTALAEARSLLGEARFPEAADAFLRHVRQHSLNKFTIAIGLFCEVSNVTRQLERSSGAPELFLLPVRAQSRQCYNVLWGEYDTQAEAERALTTVPGAIRAPDQTAIAISRLAR